MSMPPMNARRECLRTLMLMRNTRDRRLRAIVRGAIRADVALLRMAA